MELKHFFAQDTEGNVIPNATVYVYEVGTTTIATGLQDKDGNALPIPFYANEDGLIQFAAPNGHYDLRVVSGLREYRLRVQAFDAENGGSLSVQESGGEWGEPRPLADWMGLLMANERPPHNALHTHVAAIAASSTVTGSDGGWSYSKLDGVGILSSIAGINHGWGADYTGSEWVDVALPFGVVIGDSIAEGRPTYNGRLNATSKYDYDPNHESVEGQPSYELIKRTGAYWYNHGIRGDKTGDVVARWRRDVLGETYDPGDGIGNRTLPEGRKPYAVWVNVGINNGYSGDGETWEQIKADYRYMVDSAVENGIIIIFNTIGPNGKDDTNGGELSFEKQVRINAFLKNEIAARGAYVFDYRQWFLKEGTDNNMVSTLSVDGLHPTPAGHISMGQAMLRQTNAPIILAGLTLESMVDPENVPPAYVPPRRLRADFPGGTHKIAHFQDQTCVINGIAPAYQEDDSLRLTIMTAGDTAPNPNKWTGISSAYARFAAQSDLRGNASGTMYGAIKKVDGAWTISDSVENRGIVAISHDSEKIFVSFEDRFKVGHITPIAYSNDLVPGLGWSGAYPTTEAAIYLRDIGGANQDPATVADGKHFFISVDAYV